MSFKLQRVQYIPAELEPDILYVSWEFGIAVHLCACGCGSRIRTPLGPTEWSVKETRAGPTLRPSVGNWQEPCRSHYFITCGEIMWAEEWTPEQIAAGRRDEDQRRQAYYDALDRRRKKLSQRLWQWLKSLLGGDRTR